MNNKKSEIIKKEIKFQNEISSNSQQRISQSIPIEDNNQLSEILIINNDNKPKANYKFYPKDMNVNSKRKTLLNSKKPIYTKIYPDSYKSPFQKAQISNYIYKTEKSVANRNLATDYIRYNSNSKYSIKNPIKEKSKNKLNKNNYQNEYIQNKNNKNLRLINSIVNNTDITDRNNNYIYDRDEQMQIINNTNYNFRPKNEINLNININNTEDEDNEYRIDANINRIKGGNINLRPIKKQYISFNKRINTNTKNYQYQPSPRESHISYIYDYSLDNNKDSYCVESPNAIKQLSIYPLKPRIKKKKKEDFKTFNKKSPKKSYERLKKKIEDSRLKFEKIREIEKKIKNYFSSNGLNIENRELYDQSATMIQSAFRAYYSRMKLFKELNSFVNIGNLIVVLKKVFFIRKNEYWENFLKGILSYLSFIDNISNSNINSSNIQYNNNDKSAFTDINPTKKIPKSYRTRKSRKQLKNNNILLMPQLCVSFDLIKNNDYINKDISTNNLNLKGDNRKDLEEKINKLLIENEQLKKNNQNLRTQYEYFILNQEKNKFEFNDNIVKDTQKSIELQLGNELNIPLEYNNKELKKSKLKLLLRNKIFKLKECLYKYFLRFYYKSILLRNLEKKQIIYTKNRAKSSSNSIINNSNCEYSFRDKKDELMTKKLKNLYINLDKKRKNLLKNKFIKFYFKGLVHQLQNNKQNFNKNFTEINKDDEKYLNENI